MRWVYIISAAALAVIIISISTRVDKHESKRPPRGLEKRLKALRSVPYTFVTNEEVDPNKSGVVTYQPEKSCRGYNLYCGRLSSEVILMDMTGRVIHRWTYSDEKHSIWNHAVMLDNGDALIIRKLHDLIKLDWESNLVWRKEIEPHHDLAVVPDGSIYVIVRESHLHRGVSVRFPSIVHLNKDGDEIERWSTYENLAEIKQKFDQRSFIDTILDSLIGEDVTPETWEPLTPQAKAIKARIDTWPTRYDQFHMNTISILPDTPLGRRNPRFAQGNLLVCFRNVNQIAVLEKDSKEILWVWGEGQLEWPHHPTMLENGDILIFDNGTKRKYSRLIELNPVNEKIEWEYIANPVEDFYTPEKGSSQRLPNGNTLICEGDKGRAFEITRAGEIVWEWYNPALRNQRREQLYRMARIDPDVVQAILSSKGNH
jgi:hypothetical protein